MPPINLLIKPASGLCNMYCDYCFYCDITQKREQASYGMMSERTLRNVIKKTLRAASGSCGIAYQGGEPTLAGLDFFKRSIEYQQRFNVHHLPISNALQTNGYGITPEWCRFFKENHFLVGLSVDGLKATHDLYRHSRSDMGPTYDRVMETAQMFQSYGVEFNVLTVVNRQTAGQIKKIYQSYKSRGFGYQQYIACLDPLGEAAGGREYSLLPQDYGQFLTELFDLWYKDFKKGCQPYIRMFENYISLLLGMGAESCEQNGICGYQNVVEADGEVYPCDFYVLDEYKLGNLNEVSMEDIYEKRKAIGYIERSRNHARSCISCPYFHVCRGGCNRHRVYSEEENGYVNYFCPAYKMFFEQCYDRLCDVAMTVSQNLK